MLFRPHTGRQDHQTGKRTDNQGIDERLQQGHHALRHRLIRTGGGVRDRRRALPRFVGEESTVYTAVERVSKARAEEATHGGTAVKGTGKHRRE